jgi:voltage-gated sodium channel
MQQVISGMRLACPYTSMTTFCQRFTASSVFKRAIIVVILLSGVLVGLETNAALMARFGFWMRLADHLVLAVFVIELALRLGAHGRSPLLFFRNSWNVFDLLVVLLCLLPATGPFAAVLRLARVLRLLRLVSALPKLQLLVGALLKSLGAMGYVGLLLALISYVYAVAGVHLFGANDPAHFGSLGHAFYSLLRVITLDNWSEIFRAAQVIAPVLAVLYFVSFILLGTMIMLNLFIGIIMNSMSTQHTEMENAKLAEVGSQAGETTLLEGLDALDRQINALRAQIGELRHQFVAAKERARAHASAPLQAEPGQNGCHSASTLPTGASANALTHVDAAQVIAREFRSNAAGSPIETRRLFL